MQSLFFKLKMLVLFVIMITAGVLYFNNQFNMVDINLSPVAQNIRLNAAFLTIGSFLAGVIITLMYGFINGLFKKLSRLKRPKKHQDSSLSPHSPPLSSPAES